jgi:hypothetical protein
MADEVKIRVQLDADSAKGGLNDLQKQIVNVKNAATVLAASRDAGQGIEESAKAAETEVQKLLLLIEQLEAALGGARGAQVAQKAGLGGGAMVKQFAEARAALAQVAEAAKVAVPAITQVDQAAVQAAQAVTKVGIGAQGAAQVLPQAGQAAGGAGQNFANLGKQALAAQPPLQQVGVVGAKAAQALLNVSQGAQKAHIDIEKMAERIGIRIAILAALHESLLAIEKSVKTAGTALLAFGSTQGDTAEQTLALHDALENLNDDPVKLLSRFNPAIVTLNALSAGIARLRVLYQAWGVDASSITERQLQQRVALNSLTDAAQAAAAVANANVSVNLELAKTILAKAGATDVERHAIREKLLEDEKTLKKNGIEIPAALYKTVDALRSVAEAAREGDKAAIASAKAQSLAAAEIEKLTERRVDAAEKATEKIAQANIDLLTSAAEVAAAQEEEADRVARAAQHKADLVAAAAVDEAVRTEAEVQRIIAVWTAQDDKAKDAIRAAEEKAVKVAFAAQEEADKVAQAAESEAARVAAAAKAKEQAIRDSVRGSQKDLADTTTALIDYAQEVAKSGTATVEQSDKIKAELNDQLDRYEVIGQKAPANLQLVAKAWGVTSDSAVAAAKKTNAAVQSTVDEIANLVKALDKAGGGDKNKDREELAKLLEEKKKLEGQSVQSVEDLNRISELDQLIGDLTDKIDEFGSKYKGATDKAVVSTRDLNAALNDLLGSIGPKLADLTQGQRDLLRDALNRAQQLGTEGTASVDSIANAFKDVTNQLDQAGIDTTKLKTALADAKGEAVNFNEVFDDADKKGGRKKLVGDVVELRDNMEAIGEKGVASIKLAVTSFSEMKAIVDKTNDSLVVLRSLLAGAGGL